LTFEVLVVDVVVDICIFVSELALSIVFFVPEGGHNERECGMLSRPGDFLCLPSLRVATVMEFQKSNHTAAVESAVPSLSSTLLNMFGKRDFQKFADLVRGGGWRQVSSISRSDFTRTIIQLPPSA
jgi:hypothetical protein